MKYKVLWFVALASVLLALAGSALAEPMFKANIPFAFTVEHTTLPAGAYMVQVKSPDLLLIQGDSGSAFVQVIPNEWENWNSGADLKFLRSGQTYLLLQVSGAGASWDVPIRRSEKKLAESSAPVKLAAVAAK